MLPVLTLRGAVVQPGLVLPLPVGRPGSRAAVRAAVEDHDGHIVLLAQRDPAVDPEAPEHLHHVGVLAKVLRAVTPARGALQVALQGLTVVRAEHLELGPHHWRAQPVERSGEADGEATDRLRASMVEVAQHEGLPQEMIDGIRASTALALAGMATFDQRDDLGLEGLQRMLDLDLAARVEALAALWETRAGEHRAAGPPPPRRPEPPAPDDDLGDMPDDEPAAVRWAATVVCRRGGVDLDALQHEVACLTDGETDDNAALWRTIREITPQVFAQRLAEQETWPATTAADTLLTTLGALATDGYLVRFGADFDVHDAAEACRDAWTTSTRGAVAVTEQAIDRAVFGQGVNIAFVSFSDDIRPAQVAAELVERLRGAGLPVWWPHSESVAVHVPIRWLRRLGG